MHSVDNQQMTTTHKSPIKPEFIIFIVGFILYFLIYFLLKLSTYLFSPFSHWVYATHVRDSCPWNFTFCLQTINWAFQYVGRTSNNITHFIMQDSVSSIPPYRINVCWFAWLPRVHLENRGDWVLLFLDT